MAGCNVEVGGNGVDVVRGCVFVGTANEIVGAAVLVGAIGVTEIVGRALVDMEIVEEKVDVELADGNTTGVYVIVST